MNEPSTLALALIAGALLGAIFFGGLWWTIRGAVSSRRPASWFFVSLLLRTGVAVSGFYFASRGDWRRLLACLVGFLIARVLAMRLTRAPAEKITQAFGGGGP